MLEDAVRRPRGGIGESTCLKPRIVDRDDLTGLNFADQPRPEDIEGDGLARRDVLAPGQHANDQRTPPPWVACHFHPVRKEEDEAERTLQVAEGGPERIHRPLLGRRRQQMDDDFRVAGGVEEVTRLFELQTHEIRIDEIAVVRHGHLAADVVLKQGLRVAGERSARG
jgi:hypothetical protein